ncbi:tyrosine-type recombinase/integrase [Plantactinospora sp. CA-294935]|uniref:tyrosine-type recombinase/integrase n=1 Tax=Plantactinospora sp. CA-294935 TaxID=3240012 RepID=UPI003D8EF98D
MASTERRPSKDGKTIKWRVKWRTGGGNGPSDGETFGTHADAVRFKGLVNANGQHRPPAEQLHAYGFGYLAPSAPTQPGPAPEETVTLRAYALTWLETLTRPSRETKRKYRERLEKHVFPALGDEPIANITRGMLRRWQSFLLETLSPKTIANIRGETLYPLFRAACLPGENREPPVCTDNPLDGLPLPEGPRYEPDILETPDDAAILLTAAYEVDPEAADLLLTKLACGFRWGEVAALPPRAVRGHLGTVEIQQVLRKVERRWVVEPKPKTKNGYRQVPLHPLVMQGVVKPRVEKGLPFLFVAPRGNHWRYEDFYDWRWVKIRNLAQSRGLRGHLTMHGLRHSLLTLLANGGLELPGLTNVAGHKQVSTTMDLYVHETTAHHEPVRRIVGGFLEAGIRAGEAQRVAGVNRGLEIRGRRHRRVRQTPDAYLDAG